MIRPINLLVKLLIQESSQSFRPFMLQIIHNDSIVVFKVWQSYIQQISCSSCSISSGRVAVKRISLTLTHLTITVILRVTSLKLHCIRIVLRALITILPSFLVYSKRTENCLHPCSTVLSTPPRTICPIRSGRIVPAFFQTRYLSRLKYCKSTNSSYFIHVP